MNFFFVSQKINHNVYQVVVLIVFPRKFQTDQSALEFLLLFWFVTENLTGFLNVISFRMYAGDRPMRIRHRHNFQAFETFIFPLSNDHNFVYFLRDQLRAPWLEQ